jgi:Transposase DNA-binding
MTSWLDSELAECRFAEVRLGKRFRTLLKRLSEEIGETIPMACQDWARTKAAYWFISKERVSEEEILSGDF